MNPKHLHLPQDKRYETWIRSLPCLVCNSFGVDLHHMWHNRSCSYVGVPLCRGCHTRYHQIEWEEFERETNLDLKNEILTLLSVYLTLLRDSDWESAKQELSIKSKYPKVL